jgi:RNA polymerase sigma factor (sigma-70 family)
LETLESAGEVDPEAWRCVVTGLGRLITSWYPQIDPQDSLDVIAQATENFMIAVRNGRIDQGRSPVPYLVTITRNAARDQNRAARRMIPSSDIEEQDEVDDDIDGLVTVLADRQAVRDMMARAMVSGDHQVNDVVRVWLSLSERESRAVSLREVGDRLGMHPEKVRRILLRARIYLGPS